MTNPDRRISERVICRGIVRPEAAAKGWGEAKSGFVDKYVLSGFAWTFVLRVRKASPAYDILKMPLNLSSARSPISSISSSGGVVPRFSSVTMMSSTMIGGLGDLFRAVVSMSRARDVSAISGDQLKLKAMAIDWDRPVRRGVERRLYRAGARDWQVMVRSRAFAMRSHETLTGETGRDAWDGEGVLTESRGLYGSGRAEWEGGCNYGAEMVGGVMGACEARGYLRESRGFSGIEVPTSRMMLLGTRQLFSTSPRPCVS